MSIWVTNAPEVYDYAATVRSSMPMKARFALKLGISSMQRAESVFRKVDLDDLADGYYRDYQIGRYQSGGYLTMTLAKYEQEVREGYIEEYESD